MATVETLQPNVAWPGALRPRTVSSLWVKRAALALILLFALAARTDNLRQPFADAFSWRQSSTAMMAWNFYHHSANIFFPAINWSGPEPAYTGREFQTVTYIAAAFYHLFGPDEWIGRAISASFGVWGIFAFFRLTCRVWDEARAYAAALILALLPGAVFIDRSFLPDPAMLALTITTVWVYVTYLQTNQRRYLVLTGVIGVIAFLTKLPGIITIVPMAYATVAILRQQNRLHARALRPIIAMLLIASIPLAAYYAWALYLGTNYPPYHIAGGGNWVMSHGFMRWVSQGYFIKESFGRFSYWLWSAPVLALAALGLVFSPRPGNESHESPVAPQSAVLHGSEFKAPWLFHFWAGGCVLLYLVGAKELNDNPWNFHIFNPVGAALAGQGLILIVLGKTAWRNASMPESTRLGAALRMTLLIALLALHGRTLFEVMTKGYAMNGVRLGRALEKVSREGDTVVTIADDVGDPIPIYYSRRRGWVFPPAHQQEVWPVWSTFPPDDSVSISMFEQLRAEGADWLGIVADPKDDTPGKREFWKHHPALVAHFNETCEFVEKTPFWVIYRIRSPFELAQRKAAAQPALTSAE